MTIADELTKLDELRTRGALSDDEFQRAKDRLLGDAAAAPGGAPALPGLSAVNALRRSVRDKWLGGVCGGLARTTGLAAWIWRLAFTLMALFGGAGLLIYVLLWMFVPQDD